MASLAQTHHGNPFIPAQHSQAILEEYTAGNLPIAKSVHFVPFLWAQYSSYGFKFDTVQHWGIAGWYFPGHASEAYPSCGEHSYQGCLSPAHPNQAYIRLIKHNCGRAGCPICSDTWVLTTTKKIAHRLTQAAKVLRHNYGWRRTEPIHVTVSPAPTLWSQYRELNNYNKLRRKAQKIAKQCGFNGGSIIFHPYRERCSACGGAIKFKERTCEDCGAEDIVWYWSPHWHLFGFGWIHGSKAQGTGYIVKNHGVRSSIDATAYYQLTHCGIREGKQAVTWFGILHYSKLKLEPYQNPEAETDCPICGNRLRLVLYTGTKPPPVIEEEGSALVDPIGWNYRYLP